MKSSGLLHPELAALVAAGHTERIVPVDAGLPGVLDFLQALLAELAVEGVTLAEETRARSPDWYARFRAVVRARPSSGMTSRARMFHDFSLCGVACAAA